MNGDDLVDPAVLKPFPRFLLALFVSPYVMGAALALLQGSGAAAAAYGQTQNTTAPTGDKPVFRLDGGNTTYAFGVNERGELQQIYWGGRVGEHDVIDPAKSEDVLSGFDSSYNNTPQEYAGWGAELYLEPALKVTFADGSRDLVLHYASSRKQDDHSIDVVVKDISRAVIVTLHYKMDPESGIIARSATIENHEPKPIMIEQAAAAAVSLPAAHYTLSYLSGRWAGEWTLNQETIHQGQRVLESRRGSTGVQLNPWFAIGKADADEEHGETWFGALAWSGSWRITVEQDALDKVRVTGGFNPFDFGYPLKPGEKLESPVFYAGYTDHGMGGASRLLSRFTLTHILPQAPSPKLRPVIYNSWEATEWNVSEAVQESLAEKAAALGVDRFVMDDGWFGQRKNDHAGLGDWYVNKEKFPNGLKPLIDKVHSLKMDFGLWVEPEMVNPDSDLYRNHPDWVLNFPGRPRSEDRHQLVLNLARPDVRKYVFDAMDKLLAENDIAFLKWDYNRNWSEPGWDQLPANEQKKVYVEFTRNLYSILAELRARHPGVEIESCSGGGGRVDLGILHYTDEVWPSDNTDPLDRLTQQDGFTHAYPVQTMAAWVTDSPHWLNDRTTSMTYRMLVSMQGALGIGGNLNNWTSEDLATATRMIAAYHQVQKTITQGDLYRLISPTNGSEFSATETVSPDKSQAVFFAFVHSTQEGRGFPRLQLLGLDPRATYALGSIEGKAGEGTPAEASGAWWMNHGIEVALRGDFQGAAFRLDRK
jgi:alpha-galactosidase